MNPIEFRPISLDNLDAVIALEVRADQTHLVADNLYSIAQAELDPSGWCRAAYLDDTPVGFFFVKELEGGTRRYLCRFMVDRHHQGNGLGRRIMRQLLDLLFDSLAVDLVDLAVSREPGGAEGFYQRCGFTPTEEAYRGGWRMVLARAGYEALKKKTHDVSCSKRSSWRGLAPAGGNDSEPERAKALDYFLDPPPRGPVIRRVSSSDAAIQHTRLRSSLLPQGRVFAARHRLRWRVIRDRYVRESLRRA